MTKIMTKTLDYSEYEHTVKVLRDSLQKWERIKADPSKYDKTGIGINLDGRFRSVTVAGFSIDSWAGVYGSSSCSTAISVGNRDLFEKYFLLEIQRDLLGIIRRVADAIEAHSNEAKQAEITKLKHRLAELEGGA